MSPVISKQLTLGVIYGNRDFFPDHLVTEARADMAKVFAKFGVQAIQSAETNSKLGGVETLDDARKCANFSKNTRMQLAACSSYVISWGGANTTASALRKFKTQYLK